MNTIKTVEYENGYRGRIDHDPSCENPYDANDDVKIVVLHRRHSDPAKGECGRTADEVRDWAEANPGWHVTKLFLYDHSGVAYRAAPANPFHCPWDSGQVGIVALRKESWGAGLTPEQLDASANDIATCYGMWANGETFGFVIENAEGGVVDSCSGFVGLEAAEEGLAQAKEDADPGASFRPAA